MTAQNPLEKAVNWTLKLYPSDKAKVTQMAEGWGISKAEVIRSAIKVLYQAYKAQKEQD